VTGFELELKPRRRTEAKLIAECSLNVQDAGAKFIDGIAEFLSGDVPLFGPVNHVSFIMGIDVRRIRRGLVLSVVFIRHWGRVTETPRQGKGPRGRKGLKGGNCGGYGIKGAETFFNFFWGTTTDGRPPVAEWGRNEKRDATESDGAGVGDSGS